MTLLNIYSPNPDDPSFFKNIGENVSSFKCDFIVFGGDFNLVCDIHKDELECLKKKFELTDIWRVVNPDARRYTWRRKKPEIQCRLDFFLVSDILSPKVLAAEILPGYRTDHSMITVRISAAPNPRGPGFWKFLTETDYVTLIKKAIEDVSMEYDGQCEVDEVLKRDVIKMQIRAASIRYAAAKKSSLTKKEHTLEEDILIPERKLDERN